MPAKHYCHQKILKCNSNTQQLKPYRYVKHNAILITKNKQKPEEINKQKIAQNLLVHLLARLGTYAKRNSVSTA